MLVNAAVMAGSTKIHVSREDVASPRQPNKWRLDYRFTSPTVSLHSRWFRSIREVREFAKSLGLCGKWSYTYGERPLRIAA